MTDSYNDDEWGNIGDFHHLFSSLNPLVKFTMETNEHNLLLFLDIKGFRTGNVNKFDIFYKPSDSFTPPMTYYNQFAIPPR